MSGCGFDPNPAATLNGEITLDGVPLSTGTISYFPIGGGDGGSTPIDGGAYQLTGVPLGEVCFTLSALVETGRTIRGPGGAPEPELVNPIPSRYVDQGIMHRVEESGVLNFSLESDPK